MNTTITRDIITDLLPAYLSGEASPATKALVEEFMRGDPEFARLVKSESRVVFSAPAPAPADPEIRALRLAKRRLRKKVWLMSLAIFFTFTIFFFSIEPTGITWSWEISPLLTLGLALIAGFFWYAYHRAGRISRSIGV